MFPLFAKLRVSYDLPVFAVWHHIQLQHIWVVAVYAGDLLIWVLQRLLQFWTDSLAEILLCSSASAEGLTSLAATNSCHERFPFVILRCMQLCCIVYESCTSPNHKINPLISGNLTLIWCYACCTGRVICCCYSCCVDRAVYTPPAAHVSCGTAATMPPLWQLRFISPYEVDKFPMVGGGASEWELSINVAMVQ